MSKTNKSRVKERYEVKVVPEDEVALGHTEADLGTKWGAGDDKGTRSTRQGTMVPIVPGGLEAAPDKPKPQSPSQDRPPDGDDNWLKEVSQDQSSSKDSDRQSLDQSSNEDGDRQTQSLDQTQGVSDRPESSPKP